MKADRTPQLVTVANLDPSYYAFKLVLPFECGHISTLKLKTLSLGQDNAHTHINSFRTFGCCLINMMYARPPDLEFTADTEVVF